MSPTDDANSVDKKIEAAREQILQEVLSRTVTALSDSERKIVESIQTVVANAVETKYKVVVANFGAGPKVEEGSMGFEIFKIVLPVLMTIGLGFWVFVLQKGVESKIDDQKQNLGARLILTQEYQKHKVSTYETCAKDMSNLLQGLELLRIDPTRQKRASDSVHALYEDARNNSLYVSEKVAQLLNKVRSDAITDLQVARSGTMNIGTVEDDIRNAENQMKQELLAATAPLSPAH